MSESNYRFVDNPGAPEIFIDHLHDVQIINGMAHFTPVSFKRTADGIIGEPPILIVMPAHAVEPALLLTYERLPSGVIIPAMGQIARRVLFRH